MWNASTPYFVSTVTKKFSGYRQQTISVVRFAQSVREWWELKDEAKETVTAEFWKQFPQAEEPMEKIRRGSHIDQGILSLPARLFLGGKALPAHTLGYYMTLRGLWNPYSTSPDDMLARATGIEAAELAAMTERWKAELRGVGLMVTMQCETRTRHWSMVFPLMDSAIPLWKKALQKRTGLERIMWRRYSAENKPFWPEILRDPRKKPFWGQYENRVILPTADVKYYLEQEMPTTAREFKDRCLVLGWLAISLYSLDPRKPITRRDLVRIVGMPPATFVRLENSGWVASRARRPGVKGFLQFRCALPGGPFGFLSEYGLKSWDQAEKAELRKTFQADTGEDVQESLKYKII